MKNKYALSATTEESLKTWNIQRLKGFLVRQTPAAKNPYIRLY